MGSLAPARVAAASTQQLTTYGTQIRGGRARAERSTHLYGFRARYSHSISSIEQLLQGGPDFVKLHLTFRLWQALQAPPRSLWAGRRVAAGVLGVDMVDWPRGMGTEEASRVSAISLGKGAWLWETHMYFPRHFISGRCVAACAEAVGFPTLASHLRPLHRQLLTTRGPPLQ